MYESTFQQSGGILLIYYKYFCKRPEGRLLYVFDGFFKAVFFYFLKYCVKYSP